MKMRVARLVEGLLALYQNIVALGDRVSERFCDGSGLDLYVRPIFRGGELVAVHLLNRRNGENAEFFPEDLVTEPLLVLRRLGYEVPLPRGGLTTPVV